MNANLIRLADVERREIVWLEHGTIPRGMLTLLAGWPGLGKSLWALKLAAERSQRGENVIICSAEDSLEYSIKPRLQAAGANVEFIHAVVPVDGDGNPRGVSFPSDAPLLLAVIQEVAATLGIIDPIAAHLDQKVNSHNDASLRSALAPLHRVAEEANAALLGIAHLNKAEGSDPMRRLGGSIGGPGQARSALLLDRDPDDLDGPSRVLAHFKSNVGPLQPSRRLIIEPTTLEATSIEPEVTTARIVDAGESAHGASHLLANSGEDRTAIEEAVEFLRVELADDVMTSKAVQAAARDAQITERTLRRAAERVGVVKEKTGYGREGAWHWRLPNEVDTQLEDDHLSATSDLDTLDDSVVILGGVWERVRA